jgi:hypothetical protein
MVHTAHVSKAEWSKEQKQKQKGKTRTVPPLALWLCFHRPSHLGFVGSLGVLFFFGYKLCSHVGSPASCTRRSLTVQFAWVFCFYLASMHVPQPFVKPTGALEWNNCHNHGRN